MVVTQLTHGNSGCEPTRAIVMYYNYAYLYCVYALVGGAISIRDLYICAVKSHASCVRHTHLSLFSRSHVTQAKFVPVRPRCGTKRRNREGGGGGGGSSRLSIVIITRSNLVIV